MSAIQSICVASVAITAIIAFTILIKELLK